MKIKNLPGQSNKNPQGQTWRRLDNTGKLFPLVSSGRLSNVFRIAVTLKEEIEPEILQQALEDILPQFESFRVRLRRGLFWYYFETNHRKIAVEKEDAYPCQYISHKVAPYYLFRVSYYSTRINVEIYHALSDGLGAVNFAKLLACRYLQIKHQMDTPEIVRIANVRAEEEDGYLKYYKETKKQTYSNEKAYQLEGRKLGSRVENIIHGSVPLQELKAVSKSYGVSITKYLTAVLIWAIYEEYLKGEEVTPFIGVNLPINLRSMFNSETLANFFAVTAINYNPTGRKVDFEDILKVVSEQIDDQIVKEKLEEKISYNVSNEKEWYLKIVPLIIKKLALKLVFKRKDSGHTITLSNLGPIKVEEPYNKYIENFYVLIGVSHSQTAKCAVIAYEDNLMITMSTVFDDNKLSEGFFGKLEEHGISCELESNGIVDKAHDKGRYPLRQEIAAASIKKEISFAKVIVWNMVLFQIGCVLLDYVFHWQRISVNYVMPAAMLLSGIIISALMYFDRKKWQSYFMYLFSLSFASLLPIIFYYMGIITNPIVAVINMLVTIALFVLTVHSRGDSTLEELVRRLHI
ncbi:MAG: MFS transporter [Lachnospiraceae bacterium]|nr:MFS transporter [Lachnospiraceae bacterium]